MRVENDARHDELNEALKSMASLLKIELKKLMEEKGKHLSMLCNECWAKQSFRLMKLSTLIELLGTRMERTAPSLFGYEHSIIKRDGKSASIKVTCVIFSFDIL